MKIKIVLIIVLLLFCCMNVNAQWKMVYDSGHSSTGVGVFTDGNNIIAHNDFGLAITKDSGKTWMQTDTLQDLKYGGGMIVRKNTALYTYSASGIYQSTDSGMTWKFVSKWPYGQTYSGVFLSGNYMLALSRYSRVIISNDDGVTWDSSNNGLPSTVYGDPNRPSQRQFSGFVYSDSNLLAFSDFDEYISYDHGHNWHFKRGNCPFLGVLGRLTLGENIFLSHDKIYLSNDSGNTWQSVFVPHVPADGVRGLATVGKTIFAVVDNEGIIISRDSGQNWVYSNDGLSTLNLTNIAITKGFVYCGASYGKIFRRLLSEVLAVDEQVQSTDLFHLKIYPNPLKHFAKVDFGRSLKNGNFILYDMNGKQLQNIQNITSESMTLYRNGLPAGVYIYLLSEEGKKRAWGKIEMQ